MIAAPIFYSVLFIVIILFATLIKNKSRSLFGRYWAVMLFFISILILFLAVTGIISNTREINNFVAEHHFQPDNYGDLVFLLMAVVGIVIGLISSPFAYKQLKRRKKHI